MRNNRNNTQGFTLIEVMIAISIFGLLLLYASQFMRSEIHGFESTSRQNELEQKARIAMMHILDEVRLNNRTFYKSTSSISQEIRLYANVTKATATPKDETGSASLIFINTQTTAIVQSPTAKVFFDQMKGELWYQKDSVNRYLIADEIWKLSIVQDSSLASLVKIDIIAGGNNGSQSFELQTWVRLN